MSAVVVEGDFAYFTDFVRATDDIFNDFLFIFALVADDYCLHTADDHLHRKDYDDYAEHYAKDCVHCVVNVAGHNVGHKGGGGHANVKETVQHNRLDRHRIQLFVEEVAGDANAQLDRYCHGYDCGAFNSKPYGLRHCKAVDRADEEKPSKDNCHHRHHKGGKIFTSAVRCVLS